MTIHLHNPYDGTTPSQRQAAVARIARLAKFASRAKIDTGISLRRPLVQRFIAPEVIPPRPRRQYERLGKPSLCMPIFQRAMRVVSDEFGVSIDEMLSPNRDIEFVIPRYVVIGILTEMTTLSLPSIGRRLGNRDHSTIHNGRMRIMKLLEGEAFRNRFDQLKAVIAR